MLVVRRDDLRSSGCKYRLAAAAMLQPSPVERVSAIDSDGAPSRRATASRTWPRSPRISSKYGRPVRPRSSSSVWSTRITSMTRRGNGPNVPAFRYANRSSTGNSARTAPRFMSSSSPLRPGRDRREDARRAFCGRPARARGLERSSIRARARGRFPRRRRREPPGAESSRSVNELAAVRLRSPAITIGSPGLAIPLTRTSPLAAARRPPAGLSEEVAQVEVDDDRARLAVTDPEHLRRAGRVRPRRTGRRAEGRAAPPPACGSGEGIQRQRLDRAVAESHYGHQHGVRLPGERRAKPPRVQLSEAARERPSERRHRHRAERRHGAPARQLSKSPNRHFLQAHDVGRADGDQANHAFEGRCARPREGCARGRGSRCGRVAAWRRVLYAACASRSSTLGGFTVPYDHHLAQALGACAEPRWSSSRRRFRFGAVPEPEGYRTPRALLPRELSRLRPVAPSVPLKATEHLAGLGSA